MSVCSLRTFCLQRHPLSLPGSVVSILDLTDSPDTLPNAANMRHPTSTNPEPFTDKNSDQPGPPVFPPPLRIDPTGAFQGIFCLTDASPSVFSAPENLRCGSIHHVNYGHRYEQAIGHIASPRVTVSITYAWDVANRHQPRLGRST